MENYIQKQIREIPILIKKKTTYPTGNNFKARPTYLKLFKYANDFLQGKNQNRWIILTGLRGVGKTTVLFQLYRYLNETKKIDQNNILYVSIDHMKTLQQTDLYELIDAFVMSVHGKTIAELDKKLFVLVDEAHFEEKWDLKIKSIYDRNDKIFFVVTGSSALKLNMSPDSSRRLKREMMPPLNLSDYLLLKYENFYPPRGTSYSIRELIFIGLSKVKEAQSKERELKRKFSQLRNPIDVEVELFLKQGGFGFSLNNDYYFISERTMAVIDKIIKDDFSIVRDLTQSTQRVAYHILGFLATKKMGEISIQKLARGLNNISPTIISNLLDSFEKTEMIYIVKPYSSGASKSIYPWKYYFSTPTVLNILYKLSGGEYNTEYIGRLWETVVASTLYRMSKTLINPQVSLFYDSGEEGVDFILHDLLQQKYVPIEVGCGDKGFRQIKKAILKYKSGHGVLITNCDSIEVVDNVIKIPLTTFLFS